MQAQAGQPPGRGGHSALASQAPGTPGLGGAAVASGGVQQFFLTGFHQGVVDVHDCFLPADGPGVPIAPGGPGASPGFPGPAAVAGVFPPGIRVGGGRGNHHAKPPTGPLTGIAGGDGRDSGVPQCTHRHA